MRAVSHTYIRQQVRVSGLRGLVIAAAALLAGCEGSVTLDIASNSAADPAIVDVLVDLEGVQFVDDSGNAESLTFDEPLRVDLTEFVDSDLFRLFTDEQLPDGRYTSVRLLFASDEDDDNEDLVILADGEEIDLVVNGTATSEVDFTIDKDDSSRESIVLTLDLRQSLSLNDDENEFALAPLMRAVRAEDAGQLVGNVTAGCSAGTSLAEGGAVYLFAGHGVAADDRDGSDPEPYLTTGVATAGAAPAANYAFSYVPEGDYTVALTCRGNEEDALTNDELDFKHVANVEVEAEATETHNIP